MGFDDRDEREESIEDIMFELNCLIFFRRSKKDYQYSQLGFLFSDLHKATKAHLTRLLRRHNKLFNEELNIKALEVATADDNHTKGIRND